MSFADHLQTNEFPNLAQTTVELQRNLHRKLLEWVPSVQQLILGGAQQNAVPYISHRISAVRVAEREEQLQVSSIQQLLEKCTDGGRAIIYGEAGSGKTTALQNIASWWLDGQMAALQSYDFVFLIPLRLVQSHSIIDIICLDCQLLPKKTFGDTLSRTLAMKSEQVLFLLDSYEELQAVRAEELTKLISRDLHAQATVFITSRPESQVSQIKPTPCIRAELQNFSEEDVKEYTAHYLEGDQEMFSDMEEKFGMGFLDRPINLALACYMYRYMSLGIKGLHNISQTRLFSQIVLQLLIVYIKKESHVYIPLGNVLDFFSTNDKRLTGAKVFFKDICRLCHETCQKGTKWLSTVDTDISVNEFMNFGLFFPGPKPDTIDLPHRLFQEFFAALYLVRNQAAWKALFQDIKKKCQDSDSTSTTRRYLGDVLRRMGLENVVRFIVGSSPTHGQELCSLFVIKQQSVLLGNTKQSVYSYELQLLRECTADCVKSVAEALINAPVITVSDNSLNYDNNSGAEQLVNLVDMLNPKQSRQFLAKAYGCEVKENLSGQVTMSRATDVQPFVCDGFVVRCLQKFQCTALEMGENMELVHSRLPVGLLPLLTSCVSECLSINDCELLPGGDVGRRNVADETKSVAPKVTVMLKKVRGRRQLGDCHCTAPNVGKLVLNYCGDVDICGLSQTFTQLWRLEVEAGNRLVYSADWRPLHGMKRLELEYCGEAKLCVLHQLCPQLTELGIKGCRVSWPDVRSQWLSLRRLELWLLNEVKLCQVAQLFPCLEWLMIQGPRSASGSGCAVCVDDVVGQLQSLQSLVLYYSYLVRRGRRLTVEEASLTLRHIWPSVGIDITQYQVTLHRIYTQHKQLFVICSCLTNQQILPITYGLYSVIPSKREWQFSVLPSCRLLCHKRLTQLLLLGFCSLMLWPPC